MPRWCHLWPLLLSATSVFMSCTAPKEGPAQCELSSDCPEGVCRAGLCVVFVRACDGEGCCYDNTDCAEGYRCDLQRGLCYALECETSQSCGLGQVCESGRCLTDTSADRDRDGVPDAIDNCPEVVNAQGSQAEDRDQDGLGDACDDDLDGDGVMNESDNCVGVYNPSQALICEGDVDGDGLPDSIDNCPHQGNESQGDLDQNQIGDGCDPDLDGDGVPNEVDLCPLIPNSSQLDQDEDGVGDACQPELLWRCGACGVARVDEGEVSCNEVRCAQRRAERCVEGEWQTEEDCTERGALCVISDGVPRCQLPEGEGCATSSDCVTGRCVEGLCLRPIIDTPDPRCEPEASLICSAGDVWWLDSCGELGVLAEACSGGATCVLDEVAQCRCVERSAERCDGDARYDVDSCGNQGGLLEQCSSGRRCVQLDERHTECACVAQDHLICEQGHIYWESSCGDLDTREVTCPEGSVCVEDTELGPYCGCTPEVAQLCFEGDVYWVDACGERGALALACPEGATCLSSGSLSSSAECVCAPEARLGCSQGHIFWFDSCYERGALYAQCPASQVCQENAEGASCVCTAHQDQLCSDGDVYWFDSCGLREERAEDCVGASRCAQTEGGLACVPYEGDGAPCTLATEGCPELGWLTVVGGSFTMGDASALPAMVSTPAHPVTVGSFELMTAEVTVEQYEACVMAGACTEPGCDVNDIISDTLVCNYLAGRAEHPVNFITWAQAQDFASWVGGRLPSEAEWEFVARNRSSDLFPWGAEALSCTLADTSFMTSPCHGVGTSPVCTLTAGVSDLGFCDLIGNVAELMQDDWHMSYEGAPSDGSAWCVSPGCLDPDRLKVSRGGSHGTSVGPYTDPLSSTYRFQANPSFGNSATGFRLARDLP